MTSKEHPTTTPGHVALMKSPLDAERPGSCRIRCATRATSCTEEGRAPHAERRRVHGTQDVP
jgi:hypothetical protein